LSSSHPRPNLHNYLVVSKFTWAIETFCLPITSALTFPISANIIEIVT
jgi:hypothetical protein